MRQLQGNRPNPIVNSILREQTGFPEMGVDANQKGSNFPEIGLAALNSRWERDRSFRTGERSGVRLVRNRSEPGMTRETSCETAETGGDGEFQVRRSEGSEAGSIVDAETLTAMTKLGVYPRRLVYRGASTEVWRVLDFVHHEILLFKCLLPVWKGQEGLARRVTVEGEILKRIRGENILGLRAGLESTEFPALLLEGFSGRPLGEVLQKRQMLTPETAVWIGRQIVDGLCSLALIGFIHGDLRPEHVLIDEEGEVRLTGFYSSQPMHFERRLLPEGLERELFSSASYLPPELDEVGVPGHPRQDLYQLGVILYECLTGVLPFAGGDRLEMQRAHRMSTPKPIRALAPHVPREVRELVESLLFKNPLRRPQSLREVREELIALELKMLPLGVSA